MDWLQFKNIFDDCQLELDKIVIKSKVVKTLEFIKSNYSFDILKEIIAVDKKDEGIELTYHLYSTANEEDAYVVSVVTNGETESVCSIYDSACADEKEIYDMFGVKFIGNEELKRLYMPENWEGNPLKKDYEEKDERLNWNE